jgi:2'-5' RNA ligase
MDKPIRAFIAVPVPESVKEQIGLFEGDLIKTRADVKWVRPESMHVTLKFLGDVEERDTAEVVRRIEEAVGATKPFAVRIAKTGVFPNEKRPNVLWVGATEGADRLAELAGLVDSALLPMGFEKENRAFCAHLTLGRVRSQSGIDGAVRLLQDRTFDSDAFTADAVHVMRSELLPSGARYTPIAITHLKG